MLDTQTPARRPLDPFPLRHTLAHYSAERFRHDAVAGLNVAMLAFPQGIAYALIAGLPIQYGIFGGAVAAILGSLFGRGPFIMLGPTNATSVALLSAAATLGLGQAETLEALPTLLVLTGLFLVLGAIFRLANLIQFISLSVVTGYISAAAILIISNQVRTILGFSFGEDERATTFIDIVYYTGAHLGETSWQAMTVAALTAVIFGVLQKLRPAWPNVFLTLILVSGSGYLLGRAGLEFETLSAVRAGEWRFTPPSFDIETIRQLYPTAFAIALLSLLEGTSIGKSLAAKKGGRIDANQEMLNMGVANAGCGLFSGMPASGSLTRSQLNVNSGARTPLASLYCGLLLAGAVLLFGDLTAFIPKPALAVIVVTIGISLIKADQIRTVTRSTTPDSVVFWITVTAGLFFSLINAIYIGALVSILFFLRRVAAPELVEYDFNKEGHLAAVAAGETRDPQVSIVHVEGELFFGAAELFRDQIRRVCEEPDLQVLILKMRNAHRLDATSVMALEELVKYMREGGRWLMVAEARADAQEIFERSGLMKTLGEDNFFPDEPTNPTLSTAKALREAKKRLGDREARVTIYTEDREVPTQ